jgi:hypothetical protein
MGIECYLVNQSSSSILHENTLHEVWAGNNPSHMHLKVFGFDAYVCVPKGNRIKLHKRIKSVYLLAINMV